MLTRSERPTAGPWHEHRTQRSISIRNQHDEVLASVPVSTREDREARDLANARLIAAAPELLRAAEIALQFFKDNGGAENYTWFAEIEGAVARALAPDAVPCAACAHHYHDAGPCDEGKPVASPHRVADGKLNAANLDTDAPAFEGPATGTVSARALEFGKEMGAKLLQGRRGHGPTAGARNLNGAQLVAVCAIAFQNGMDWMVKP